MSKPKFGRNQKIAMLVYIAPFAASTTALFLNMATFHEWGEFVRVLTGTVAAIALGGSALVKGVQALAGAKPTPPPLPKDRQ